MNAFSQAWALSAVWESWALFYAATLAMAVLRAYALFYTIRLAAALATTATRWTMRKLGRRKR